MKSILITGGTGSFGTAFVKRLLNIGVPRICILSRGEHRQAEMRKELNDDSRLRCFIGDIRDRGRLVLAMAGCSVVVHAAALKRIEVGFRDPLEMKKTNIDGAANVIEAAQATGVERVVFLSTDKAFQPVSPYGLSKAYAESLFLAANNIGGICGPRFAVTRYGNVWKSAGSVVPIWQDIIRNGGTEVPVTDPDCTRFFMHMREAVDLVLETIATMNGGETMIPTLPAYRLGDLATAMGAKMNVRGLPEYEKLHESMCEGNSSEHARRMTIDELGAAL